MAKNPCLSSWASYLTSLDLSFSIYFRGLLRELIIYCMSSSWHTANALKMLLPVSPLKIWAIASPDPQCGLLTCFTSLMKNVPLPKVRKLSPLKLVCLYWSHHTASMWRQGSNKEGWKAPLVPQYKGLQLPYGAVQSSLSHTATCPNNRATSHSWFEAPK